MRRVLVVAYDFPPIASAAAERARQLVRHLPAHGWQPVVVTPRRAYSWAYDPTTAADLPAGLEVHRTLTIEPGRILRRMGRLKDVVGNGTMRGRPFMARMREWVLVPDARAGWIPFAVVGAALRARRTEVMLSTSPPASTHLAGAVVSRAAGLPWVADFQDPWSLQSFEGWRGRWRPWLDARLERFVLGKADRVTATTRWLADELSRRGAEERVGVVPNGYEVNEFPSCPPRDRRVFTILHAGSFYGPRSPEPLISAVGAAVEAEPGIRSVLRVRLLGSHDARNQASLDTSIRRLGLSDVVERAGQRPRQEALAAMRGAGVLALVTDALEGGRGLIPLKVYEYLGAGRPILALCPPDGETGQLVRRAGGTVVDPADVQGAAGAIRLLYERWSRGEGDLRPDPSIIEEFRWERLAEQMARVLDEAVEGGR